MVYVYIKIKSASSYVCMVELLCAYLPKSVTSSIRMKSLLSLALSRPALKCDELEGALLASKCIGFPLTKGYSLLLLRWGIISAKEFS